MPSPERVQKALDQIRKRPANHDYFFEKLSSPDWIEPLAQAGLFSAPPSANRDDGDTISFPFWPESQYLARMASIAPEQVLSVIEEIPETDNVRIHDDFARAAVAMPGPLAARWARREIIWIEKQEYLYFLLPDSLGELWEHLARTGEIDTALKLAKALLRLSHAGKPLREVRALFDSWEYEQILKIHGPTVLQIIRIPALNLLCDLLSTAIVDEADELDGVNDYSWIWRPAIEDHTQNHGHGDIRDILVDVVRDAATLLAQPGPTECYTVLDELKRHQGSIFRRLELHLLHEHRDLAFELAVSAVANQDNFGNSAVHHEYFRLLRTMFPLLKEDLQNRVLGWIAAGPTSKEIDENPELQTNRTAYWQAQRLAIIKDDLPESWQARYDRLIQQVGEPNHPDFLVYMTTWWGPTSPKDQSELEQMSAEEIAQFLRSWEPSDVLNTHEPEGLSRTLEAVIAVSPARFVANLGEFRELNPTYARALVHGLTDAAKRGEMYDWKPVLEYLDWIVSRPRFLEEPPSGKLDQDPHWGWARKAVASLLSIGFEKSSIALSLRTLAWGVLRPLTDDPDPTPEDDARSSMDPAMHSINTARGEAMHAVIRYALWVHRGFNATMGTTADRVTFEVMPEVREVLEHHLQPEHDPSPAIRAVYGQWFPWLLLLDHAWAIDHKDTIFTQDIANARLRDSAWNTYVVLCPVYNDPFEVLQLEYSAAVDRLAEEQGQVGWTGDPQKRLGEHLMVLVGRGVISFEDKLGLCRRFFENASDQIAGHAIAFIGQSLRDENRDVLDLALERFRHLWDELLIFASTSSVQRLETLKAFGWWFASGRFEQSWSLNNLLEVLRLAGDIAVDSLVIERLADLADADPATTLKILRALTQVDQRGWRILGSRESARAILESALRDPSTAENARDFVHELGARGYLQFRDLLGETTSDS